MRGRKKPYTEIGISRIPCARCGDPSSYQWQSCANNNYWMGLCKYCDFALNELVLQFFRFDNYKCLLEKYAKRISVDKNGGGSE